MALIKKIAGKLELTDALVHGFSQKFEIFPSFGFIKNSLRKSVV